MILTSTNFPDPGRKLEYFLENPTKIPILPRIFKMYGGYQTKALLKVEQKSISEQRISERRRSVWKQFEYKKEMRSVLNNDWLGTDHEIVRIEGNKLVV